MGRSQGSRGLLVTVCISRSHVTHVIMYGTSELALEQCRCELCGSTYMWIFSSSKYYSTTWSVIG